ncbi:translation initiation factor IF-2 [Coxiella endosymbiont of Amblyomma americanum]|uniref:translation initiation factor IF-2 n=1 Tax=Coxiella endosymbiont of Amblyomma americanum TaxID=325775 RepID=UPI00057CCCDC|nr:translation initiation factor IF-2 [Coxiella endosymbiont of Amblyomma americanum]AJC50283.1 translation initiation factor IF-2 [Coxiella endosymbiont of Amblyomma americanum]AUJ58636.1 translation initiation factor IF-2 [Coxiella-like endosymbiont of Amblyomma americanum]
MTNIISVKQLAGLIRITPEYLLARLKDAGVAITNINQTITNDQKRKLLLHLKTVSDPLDREYSRIILKRKKLSVMRLGKKRISVEIRSRYTYEKPIIISAEEPLKASVPKSVTSEMKIEEKTVKSATHELPNIPKSTQIIKPNIKKKKQLDEINKGIPKKIVRKTSRSWRENEECKAWEREELHMSKLTEERRRRKLISEATNKVVTSKLEHSFAKPTVPIVHEVTIPEFITVFDLAQRMSVKASVVIKAMMKIGVVLTVNQRIDQETAEIIVGEMGHTAKLINGDTVEKDLEASLVKKEIGELKLRPPIVTIMGHVDHGKTSLLDYIRRTKIISTEAGGITQHIGACCVETALGMITFLDTPGHEAFTAMRARGAKCTDIIVLVVAADDGVMPQTIEAIQHARAAKVPLVVAINKIDKLEADPDRIKTELSRQNIIPEEWGGETLFQLVSAKTGEGIDALLECILLQAEVLELKALGSGLARGIVIESRLDKKRGPVATILVMSGELHPGDILLVGQEYGRIRAMLDGNGLPCLQAKPSIPVEVLGLSNIPMAGEKAVVVQDERKARAIARFRQEKYREMRLAKKQTTLVKKHTFSCIAEKNNILNIVLKADVQGSLEALIEALCKLSTGEILVNIVAGGVGRITESDVRLAIASDAVIIGFNVLVDVPATKTLAENEGIKLCYYSVIYDLIDSVKKMLSEFLAPEFEEKIIGLATVREVFFSSKIGTVAGCMVTTGVVRRHFPFRILRDKIVIYEGKLESLRRYKEDITEVRQGVECGIGIKHHNDVKTGDRIEVFEKIQVDKKIT